MNTLNFAQRWTPLAFILLILALPAPRIDHFFRLSLASFMSIALLGTTLIAYRGFNRCDMKNYSNFIDQTRAQDRILQLDYVKTSTYIKSRPFLQLAAYFQAINNSKISFSFMQHGSGIVNYKVPPKLAWNHKLDWFAESLRITDLYHFDQVIINADDLLHDKLAAHFGLIPITATGRWRMYHIDPDSILLSPLEVDQDEILV